MAYIILTLRQITPTNAFIPFGSKLNRFKVETMIACFENTPIYEFGLIN